MVIANRRNPLTNYTTVASAPVAAVVGTTSALLVANNNSRSGLVVVNPSDTAKVFLAFGTDAILNGGLCLMPGVGWRMDANTFVVDSVSAISDQAGTAVAVQEFSL